MNTGGPAFPQPNHIVDSDLGREEARGWMADSGMSMLDWYAGQALAGMLASPNLLSALIDERETDDTPKPIAIKAYEMASAMLAEKARREATGKQDLQVPDHSGDANKMAEDHFRDAAKMTKLEAQNRELVERQNTQLWSILRQAELAIAFANREPNVIRMLGDDYTDVLQLIRAALKEEKP